MPSELCKPASMKVYGLLVPTRVDRGGEKKKTTSLFTRTVHLELEENMLSQTTPSSEMVNGNNPEDLL